jgi:hypothetical protein
MRATFFIFMLIHGVIHAFGFLKVFSFVDANQLAHAILRPVGMFWLMGSGLFLAASLLGAFSNYNWSWIAIIGIIVSQILMVYFWQDTKFGTVANVIILIGVIIQYASSEYHLKYENDVENGLRQNAYFENSTLNETDIASLPSLVKKYIRYTSSIGKPKVNNFKVEFTGKIRKDEKSPWMPFTSQQYNFMQSPTRLFFMKAVMKKLPVTGYHAFKDGHAFMDIRLLSLFKVQFQDGPQMDVSETVTFFNDMCCLAPATLIDKRINWLEIDGNRVKASFISNHITVFAWLYFNDEGALINFISLDRYAADTGKQLPWATPLNDYQHINGYRLMRNAETIYNYPDKDFCYGTFKLVSVKYNCLANSD